MDGIEILNKYETLTNAGTIFFFVVWGFVAIALMVCFLYDFIKNKPKISTGVLIIIAGALAIVCFCNIPEKKYEMRYQVTVDNSITMNEFQEKYEIIEVEGKIYTVKERAK